MTITDREHGIIERGCQFKVVIMDDPTCPNRYFRDEVQARALGNANGQPVLQAQGNEWVQVGPTPPPKPPKPKIEARINGKPVNLDRRKDPNAPTARFQPGQHLVVRYHGDVVAHVTLDGRFRDHSIVCHDGEEECKITFVPGVNQINFYAKVGTNRETYLRDVEVVEVS